MPLSASASEKLKRFFKTLEKAQQRGVFVDEDYWVSSTVAYYSYETRRSLGDKVERHVIITSSGLKLVAEWLKENPEDIFVCIEHISDKICES